jgi:uncharacterized protein (DUF885 family)
MSAERQAAHPFSLGVPARFERWEDVSDDGHTGEMALLDSQVAALSGASGTTVSLYRDLAARRRRELAWFVHAFPVNHLLGVPNQSAGGLRIPHYLIARVARGDSDEAERYAELIEASSAHLLDLAARIASGALTGIRLPQHSRVATLAVIDAMLPTGGGLFADGEARARELPERMRTGWQARVRAAVAANLVPGLAAIRDAVEAMPLAAEEADGVWALPDGDAFYADVLADWTADRTEPARLHAEAADAVRRLKAEVAEVGASLGYAGGFRAIVDRLRSDPAAYYSDDAAGREACLTRARALTAAIAAEAPTWFGPLPRTALEVVEVEPERAATAVFGDYSPPAAPLQPGRYYLNLADMAKLPRHELAALSFHEGLPGHHLQIARALENEGLAPFQRRPFLFEGFAEGWAMYAEALGFEMLKDTLEPRDRLGLLLRQLWMAVRAVADTGLHAMRWPRERVIAMLLADTGVSRSLAEAEADRYAVWPGQACAYHVGRSALEALRAASGPAGTRDFHDRVLGAGSVPLFQLRAMLATAAEPALNKE